MSIIKLTPIQKNRLSRLEPQLKKAIASKDLEAAKRVVVDIQSVLKPTGHITKLIAVKNWLYELAIDVGEYSYAESGLIGNRKLLNKNTRTYLEATALLAICYIRINEYEKAKPLIKEVLKNEKVIKSENTRQKFHSTIIERFDEEAALFSLKSENSDFLDIDEINEKADKLLEDKSENQIYYLLGKSLPPNTKYILFQIDEFSKNQLPSAERKLLPSSQDVIDDENAGRTLFNSLKRVTYNSLCNPESEIYKAWYTNGIGMTCNKKFLATAIVAALNNLGIGFKALAISAVTLILKVGLEIICDYYKPTTLMDIRVR